MIAFLIVTAIILANCALRLVSVLWSGCINAALGGPG
jgi:hypothetical protein